MSSYRRVVVQVIPSPIPQKSACVVQRRGSPSSFLCCSTLGYCLEDIPPPPLRHNFISKHPNNFSLVLLLHVRVEQNREQQKWKCVKRVTSCCAGDEAKTKKKVRLSRREMSEIRWCEKEICRMFLMCLCALLSDGVADSRPQKSLNIIKHHRWDIVESRRVSGEK